jgi:hypothetical protein
MSSGIRRIPAEWLLKILPFACCYRLVGMSFPLNLSILARLLLHILYIYYSNTNPPMHLYPGHEKEELHVIERLINVIDRLITYKKPEHHFVAFFSINSKQNQFLIMSLTLQVGQTDVVGIQVVDSISGNVLTNAVLSGQTYSGDNTAAVGLAPDADATKEDLTALAAGVSNLSGSVTADLSAYGLGTAVVLPVAPVPVSVVPAVTVAPVAQFIFAPPVTPAPAPAPAS